MELTRKWVSDKLPKRPQSANKGTFGKVLVIAGSEKYPGAAYLTCAAAYRVGAGLVTLTTNKTVKIIVSKKLPEVTFLSYGETLQSINKYNSILIGPGLGQDDQAIKRVKQLLNKDLPKAVIDADALNILPQTDNWWDKINGEIILTPHPGEMATLTGLTIEEIQEDRINVAQSFAKKWGKVVVLKGAGTVIVSPIGETLVSPFANPVLATAGTGDVLAGIIIGLLAQGLTSFDAACVSVYIHGMAGEILRKKIGDAGLLASDLLPLLPQILKKLR